MPSLNKVILIGNLTADPELKKTTSGVCVCSFSIGVSRKYKNQDGTTTTDFINIRTWRQQAEFASKYFKKGSAIIVCGSIQVSSYTNKQGQKSIWTEVVADEVSFATNKSQSGGYTEAPDVNSFNPPAFSSGNDGGSYTPPAYASGSTDKADQFEELSGSDDLPF